MADNYLGNKMEEHRAKAAAGHPAKPQPTLNQLLTRNRSVRGYDATYAVSPDQLRRIIEVNTRIPSARNQQVLRFRPVWGDEAARVLPHIRLGGALKELHLPLPGTEPNAFILICSTEGESRYVDIDLGISAQSMLLKATEMGLNGICIGAFDKAALTEIFHLPSELLLVLAVGKSAETFELREIAASEGHNYYRENGKHIVPKVRLDDLII